MAAAEKSSPRPADRRGSKTMLGSRGPDGAGAELSMTTGRARHAGTVPGRGRRCYAEQGLLRQSTIVSDELLALTDGTVAAQDNDAQFTQRLRPPCSLQQSFVQKPGFRSPV